MTAGDALKISAIFSGSKHASYSLRFRELASTHLSVDGNVKPCQPRSCSALSSRPQASSTSGCGAAAANPLGWRASGLGAPPAPRVDPKASAPQASPARPLDSNASGSREPPTISQGWIASGFGVPPARREDMGSVRSIPVSASGPQPSSGARVPSKDASRVHVFPDVEYRPYDKERDAYLPVSRASVLVPYDDYFLIRGPDGSAVPVYPVSSKSSCIDFAAVANEKASPEVSGGAGSSPEASGGAGSSPEASKGGGVGSSAHPEASSGDGVGPESSSGDGVGPEVSSGNGMGPESSGGCGEGEECETAGGEEEVPETPVEPVSRPNSARYELPEEDDDEGYYSVPLDEIAHGTKAHCKVFDGEQFLSAKEVTSSLMERLLGKPSSPFHVTKKWDMVYEDARGRLGLIKSFRVPGSSFDVARVYLYRY